jgi:saccharopine dehydrogenase (NAD+, L-lysine-forming)
MRVAVLGAGGTIAPAIVRDLAESDEADELLLLDIDEERARAVAEAHGAGKARAARVDARAEPEDEGSLARALDGSDVLVNSASYRVNLDAMAACLHAGCHYLDLGGLYWMTELQLELDTQFERDGLLALLGMGSAPGKTNLMARMAARELTGDPAAPASGQARMTGRPSGSLEAEEAAGVDSIQVAAAGRDLDPPDGFSVPYALQTLLDELTMRPVVLRGGSPRQIDPLSDGGVVDFGTPIGEAETIYTIHSEMRTFGDSFGCREASFRLGLKPQLLSALRELTMASEDEVRRKATQALPPSAKTMSVHVVDAAADGRAVRVRAVTEPMEKWGIGGGVVSTATPVAAVVRLLARGTITERGVLPPEGCVDPDALFAELEPRGCRVEVKEAVS